MSTFVPRKLTNKADNYYNWLKLIVNVDLPFTVVEDELFNSFSCLTRIIVQEFVTALRLLGQWMQEEKKRVVAKAPCKSFGIILDTWAGVEEHYRSVAITWTDDAQKDSPIKEMYISFKKSYDPERRTADALLEYLEKELSVIGLNLFEHIDYVVADSSFTNRCVVRKINRIIRERNDSAGVYEVQLIGCKAHQVALAKKEAAETLANPTLSEKVNELLLGLQQYHNHKALGKFTEIEPYPEIMSRWSSTFGVLQTYHRLEKIIDKNLAAFDQHVANHLLNESERKQVQKVLKVVRKFDNIDQIFLGKDKEKEEDTDKKGKGKAVKPVLPVNWLTVRQLLDEMRKTVGALIYQKYLAPTALILPSPAFEAACTKIMRGEEDRLTAAERQTVQRFYVEGEVMIVDSNEPAVSSVSSSSYRGIPHIPLVSNRMRRAFRKVWKCRENNPDDVPTLLLLRLNREMWTVQTVGEILESEAWTAAIATAEETVKAAGTNQSRFFEWFI